VMRWFLIWKRQYWYYYFCAVWRRFKHKAH
jgi:hypothetical protein